MKRLIALLGFGALVLFAGEAVAGGMLPTLAVKQLRWADYSDAYSSGIAAYRDTAFLPLTDQDGGCDTTEVLSTSDFAFGFPGEGISTGSGLVGRLMIAGSLANADSLYYAIDGAYTPTGPWFASTWLGRVSHLTGQYTQGLAHAIIAGDVDNLTGVTATDMPWRQFPYIRFRVHTMEAGAAFPGASCYFAFYKWDGTNIGEMRGSAPKYVTKQLRWLVSATGAADNGRYLAPTYRDTTYIYKSADTTTTTTCVDTTEALDMSQVVIDMIPQTTSSATSGLSFALEANAATGGTQSDSVQVYVDIGLTPNGPWSYSTQPHVYSRTGGGKVIFGKLLSTYGTTGTLGNETRFFAAPYLRFRIKTEFSTGSGYQGAKFYVGYTPREN